MLAIPSNLSPEAAQSILNAYANDLAEKEARERDKQRILECDAAFAEYEQGERPYLGPLVRANTYAKVKNTQELGGWAFQGDPRRPVRMRGSYQHMIALHSRSHYQARNGYCTEILNRYIRMSKITLVYYIDIYNFMSEISGRVCTKHQPYNYHCRYPSDGIVIIGGKFVYMNKEQLEYVRKLYGIVKNTEKLDKLHG